MYEVRSLTLSLSLFLFLFPIILRTSSAVRVSHQTTALWRQRPVVLSHKMVVSRWLVIPTPFSRLRSCAFRAPPTSSMQVRTDW